MSQSITTVDILTFGQLIDITGQNSFQVESVSDTDQLLAALELKFPALSQSKFLVAVNKEIIRGNVKLNPGDVVALLPPFSGG